MSFGPEHKIWINNSPEVFAKVHRVVNDDTKEVTVTVRHLSGKETTHPSCHETVYKEQKPDLFHGDSSSGGNVKKTVVVKLNPSISLDKIAVDVAPAKKINLPTLSSTDPDSKIINGEDLIQKGFQGFLVDNEKKHPSQSTRQQTIFNLSIVDRIITSPKRDLLLILWRNTDGKIKETHFSFSSVRRWALLTEKEVSNKNPHFSKKLV